MSYIHLHAGRGPEALRLLQAALRIADNNQFNVNPAVCSWLYEAMGEAYAIAGDRIAGARSLARSEQLFDAVVPEQVPPWLGFFNAEVHLIRLKGRCLMRLGDCQAAIATVETARKLLPEHYVRERSGTLY
jgi:tetratricopeptide (TPR) repeat protein